jgi:hypothetical protein
VIKNVGPHILGICEAANEDNEHKYFIDTFLPGLGYKVASGASRGGQNLVFYHKPPVELVNIDVDNSYYDDWQSDVEGDRIIEQFKWERKPLEAVFKLGANGPLVRIILVHSKSKGIFDVVDLANFQRVSLTNRRKLIAQASRLRERIDFLLQAKESFMVMGDMNDGPNMDSYEKLIGKSFVETVMGDVYNPDTIIHNTLWHMQRTKEKKLNCWTACFKDPIVNAPLGRKHMVWIDHILASPDMLQQNNPVNIVKESGNVYEKNTSSYNASDHFAVYCDIETHTP